RPASTGAAEITSRRSTHDRLPFTASRKRTRSPGVSFADRAGPRTSNGMVIAFMKPGNASCEIVTVAAAGAWAGTKTGGGEGGGPGGPTRAGGGTPGHTVRRGAPNNNKTTSNSKTKNTISRDPEPPVQ